MTFVEKRKFPRHHFIAEIQYKSNSPKMKARIADISEGGIFIDTVTPLERNMTVNFSFYIPDSCPTIAISGRGRVAWVDMTVGMGIEFLEVDETSRRRIVNYLKSL